MAADIQQEPADGGIPEARKLSLSESGRTMVSSQSHKIKTKNHALELTIDHQ